MKISELEKHLKDIREGHGDLQVYLARNQNLYNVKDVEAAFIEIPGAEMNIATIKFNEIANVS